MVTFMQGSVAARLDCARQPQSDRPPWGLPPGPRGRANPRLGESRGRRQISAEPCGHQRVRRGQASRAQLRLLDGPAQPLHMLQKLHFRGLLRTVITYNAAISACETGQRPQQALHMLPKWQL